ncbi:tyrosine-protein kinase domain-containing protein [Gordonia sputi]
MSNENSRFDIDPGQGPRSNWTPALGSSTQHWRSLKQSVSQRWWVVVLLVLLGGIGANVVTFTMTPEYKSTATLYVTSGSEDSAQSAYQGSLASQQRVASYLRLVTTDNVVNDALETSGLPIELNDAKSSLSGSAAPGTVLLSVTARRESASQAALLANAVSESLIRYVSSLEVPAGGSQAQAKLTLVSPALVEEGPSSPQPRRNLVFGLLVGLVLGLCFVVAYERVASVVRSSEELGSLTSVAMLGSIPDDGVIRDSSSVFGVGSHGLREAFRRVRSNLGFVTSGMAQKRILVTSTRDGEGKSTIAFRLASSLAELGKRVLLVDADLRRPVIASRLGLNGSVGLSSCLSSDVSVSDAIQTTSILGVSVLTSGPIPPNPSELLSSARARELFDELGEAFDYVVVDCAPMLPVVDALAASELVDGVVLVAQAGRTRPRHIVQAINELELAGSSLVGAILNRSTEGDMAGGYYYSGHKDLMA